MANDMMSPWDAEDDFDRDRREYMAEHGWTCGTCGRGEEDCEGGTRCPEAPDERAVEASESLWAAYVAGKATAYADALKVGCEIHDDTDGATIEAFRHLLPAALAKRGLCLEPVRAGVFVVVDQDEPTEQIVNVPMATLVAGVRL